MTIFELFFRLFYFHPFDFPPKNPFILTSQNFLIAIGDKKERKKEKILTSVSLCSTKKLKKGTNKLLNPQKYVTRQRTINTHWNPIFLNLFSFFLLKKKYVPHHRSKRTKKTNKSNHYIFTFGFVTIA